jgi:hypothetical protein
MVAQTQKLIKMKTFQNNIQEALDSKNMKPYGKLTNLLNNALRSGLINTKQLEELDANLEQLRLGNNTPLDFKPRCSESSYNDQGLRWVSEEVGYVDEDEEYR